MKNDTIEESPMPLTAHLEELKTRLIRVLIVVGIGFGVCYLFKDWSFRVITKPLVDAMPAQSSMIFTGLPEAFFIHMKIAFFASLLLTAPYTLFEIWRFVSPGLYKDEKKVRPAIPVLLDDPVRQWRPVRLLRRPAPGIRVFCEFFHRFPQTDDLL